MSVHRITARRRRAAAAAAAIGGTLASLAIAAGPAQAYAPFSYSDTFDVGSHWSPTVVGTGSAKVINNGVPGSTPGSGGLGEISSQGSGFSSLGQLVHRTGDGTGCYAQASLRTLNRPATVNVEIIRPSDWRYMGLTTVNLPAYSSWTPGSVSWSQPLNTDFVFRVSVLGQNATSPRTVDVDNMSVNCDGLIG